MKCLTVRQPWAHAIFALGKDVENRTWWTPHRGPLMIHAGRTLDSAGCEHLGLVPAALVRGAYLGTVELVDCIRRSPSPWAVEGQWHWILRNPRWLPRPLQARGHLGLFEVEGDGQWRM